MCGLDGVLRGLPETLENTRITPEHAATKSPVNHSTDKMFHVTTVLANAKISKQRTFVLSMPPN